MISSTSTGGTSLKRRIGYSPQVVVAIPDPANFTCSFSVQLAAMIMPPSSWFLAPSGLIIWPQSATHHIWSSLTSVSTLTAAAAATRMRPRSR